MTYFHEERHFRQPWIWALVAMVVLTVVIVLVVEAPVLPSLVAPSILLAVVVLLLFARLVVDVDREAITVRFHLLWPTRRIPLADVRRAHATRFSPILDYGGWGVRLGLHGWAFNVSGSEGVLLERTNGSRLMIGSRRAKELEAAIARAIHDRVDV